MVDLVIANGAFVDGVFCWVVSCAETVGVDRYADWGHLQEFDDLLITETVVV